MHLRHDRCAMTLNRPGADSQFAGDDLVGRSLQQSRQDLSFPAGQGLNSIPDRIEVDAGSGRISARDRLMDRINQRPVAEGLLQQIGRSATHRFDHKRDIGVRCDNNNRQSNLANPQILGEV